MASDLYWQRSMGSWDWSSLQGFLDERLPEGLHLEYKQPTHNKQNSKWEITPKFIEHIVSMANTDGGLFIVGVADTKDNRPGEIVGINHRDPVDALRSHCANSIEPTVPLEIQAVQIPEPEKDAGKTILVVRIRRGLNPPYLLRDHGVYLRVGDQDRHASVRDLQALFERRAAALAPESITPNDVFSRIFQHFNALDHALPPVVGVTLTPTFPISPVILDAAAESWFAQILNAGLGIGKQPFLRGGRLFVYAPAGTGVARSA